ncbi:hypothetical protein DZC78_01795 [Olleya aquimaris]|nr:hypothetical protein DZC78_01795 [Olleya aquimaris]
MKKLFYLFLLFFVVTLGVDAQEWVNYKSEELAFIAEFPNQPEYTFKDIETEDGTSNMHMVTYYPDSRDENIGYSIIRSDFSKSQFENATIEYNNSILNEAVESAVSSLNGELQFVNKIRFNGYPGRNVKIKMDDAFIYLNLYLVENKLFLIQIMCLAQNDKNESITRFFQSFDLLKIKE